MAVQRWAQRRKQMPTFRLDGLDVILAAMVVWSAFETLTSPSRAEAFTSLRGYLQPIGVFLVARGLRPSPKALRTLLVAWLGLGALIAATGGWGFQGWAGNSRDQTLVSDGGAGCYECHTAQAERDYVFSTWRN